MVDSSRIAVLLDTSTLRGTSWSSAPFQSLLELSTAERLDIFVPEIVYQERRTQWRDEYSKRMKEAESTLRKYISDPLIADPLRERFNTALKALPVASDGEATSNELFEKFFAGHRVARLPMTGQHTTEVFARYFRGEPPFKEIKARNDIPDGFIFVAAAELVSVRNPLHCVCVDNELGKALTKVPGVVVHISVDDLLRDPTVIETRAVWEADKTWQVIKPRVPFDRVNAELERFIREHIEDFVVGKRVRSPEIPDDNNEATVHAFGEPEDIEIGGYEDWGGGWISAPVHFLVDVSISFFVFRSDAFDVPSWVSVSYGDPEEDHYFEAEGDVRVRVHVVLSGRVDLTASFEDTERAVLQTISIEDKPRLEFIEPT
jgi:PIN domain